jgi:death-on-curing protein
MSNIDETEVITAHRLIESTFPDVESGIRDKGLLSSAVHRQFTGFGEFEKWTTSYQKMATLFYGIIQNHAFVDGNKRTALLVLLLHLRKNNLYLNPNNKKHFLKLAYNIVEKKVKDYYSEYNGDKDDAEINFIATFIEQKSHNYGCNNDEYDNLLDELIA